MSVEPLRQKASPDVSKICFFATVFVAVALAAENIRSNPVEIDEYAHVPAGLSYWDFGRHYVYRENPPLVRLLTSLPVWLSSPRISYRSADPSIRSEWGVGRDFLNANASRYHFLIGEARCVSLILAVACAYLIYVWARRCYGSVAAPVLASLWLLYPTVLAHAAIASVDVGACFFGLLAAYLLWRFLQRPGWHTTVFAGIGLGLAQGSKFTMLFLYPSLLLICVTFRGIRWVRADEGDCEYRPSWLRVAIVLALSVVVLDAIYVFDRVGRPLGSFQFKSYVLSGQPTVDAPNPPQGNQFRQTWLGQLPVPLPEDYVLGLDSQKWEEEIGFYRPAPAGGLVHGGAWYSPLVTVAFKLPLGTIALILGSTVAGVICLRHLRYDAIFMSILVAMFFLVLGSQTGLNWAARYSLPSIPFLALLIGQPIQVAWNRRAWRWLMVACVGWNLLVVLLARPHFLSYGNELIGGKEGVRHFFAGSDLDLGQDLYRLAQWRIDHPDRRPMNILYYGALNPGLLGLNDSEVPDFFLDSTPDDQSNAEPRKHLYLAISANLLLGSPAQVILESGRSVIAYTDPRLLSFDDAFARVGMTIYLFEVVPALQDARTARPILFDRLRSCLHEIPITELKAKMIL